MVLAALSFPVFLISYGQMLIAGYERWPVWISVCVTVAHVFTALGASALHDQQQERRSGRSD